MNYACSPITFTIYCIVLHILPTIVQLIYTYRLSYQYIWLYTTFLIVLSDTNLYHKLSEKLQWSPLLSSTYYYDRT